MTYEKLRGAEGRGGGRWGDKQATSSPRCPFLYTVVRMQVFTCKHQKEQFSTQIQSKFQKVTATDYSGAEGIQHCSQNKYHLLKAMIKERKRGKLEGW